MLGIKCCQEQGSLATSGKYCSLAYRKIRLLGGTPSRWAYDVPKEVERGTGLWAGHMSQEFPLYLPQIWKQILFHKFIFSICILKKKHLCCLLIVYSLVPLSQLPRKFEKHLQILVFKLHQNYLEL